MRKGVIRIAITILIMCVVTGCGETMRGMAKDIDTMGRNIKSYDRTDAKESDVDEYVK